MTGELSASANASDSTASATASASPGTLRVTASALFSCVSTSCGNSDATAGAAFSDTFTVIGTPGTARFRVGFTRNGTIALGSPQSNGSVDAVLQCLTCSTGGVSHY